MLNRQPVRRQHAPVDYYEAINNVIAPRARRNTRNALRAIQ